MFTNCSLLEEVNMCNATSIHGSAASAPFAGTKVKILKCPNLTYLGHYMYKSPSNMAAIICGDKVTKIEQYVGNTANNISNKRLVIQSLTPPTMQSGTKITNFSAQIKIFVPDSAVEDYKASTAFNGVAARINPLSEYPYPEELMMNG